MQLARFSSEAIRVLRRHNVIFVDTSILVINKPAGLICQGTKSEDSSTRGGSIQPALDELAEALGQQEPLKTVHRLDKHTTGALVLALNARAVSAFHAQSQSLRPRKTYYALVTDTALRRTFTAPPKEPRKGHITSPLAVRDGRVSVAHTATEATDNGVSISPASTKWECLASSPTKDISLLRLDLETGVKHQLRVHLASVLRCPILGDTLHGPTTTSSLPLCLHSHAIALTRFRKQGPKKRYELSITAPLHQAFIRACHEAGIPLSAEDIGGSVRVDGQLMKSCADIQGTWFG
ncbi:hypothetical protein FRB95_004651 [Tulasnella sp. JGI-2019a]|nr:hypothetical protein FRB95_004651 [Tulasnella sp. JGI-2019a]